MASLRTNQVVGAYLAALQHHRHSMEQAGNDLFRSWFETCLPQDSSAPLSMDRPLQASVALWQVHADAQRELQRQGGVWLSAWHLACQNAWPEDCVMRQLLQISQVSCGSLSKVTRQVGYFAVTRWGSAALEAQRTATALWRG